jgi:hypothetical protein
MADKENEVRPGDAMRNAPVQQNMWYNKTLFTVNIPAVKITAGMLVALVAILILWALITTIMASTFENKPYDPFGTGIRFEQRRDDTGSFSTSLGERQYGAKQMNDQVSQLTSTPEPPNFSEYYGIDASLKNGSVMIERENFENSAISLDKLENANRGF